MTANGKNLGKTGTRIRKRKKGQEIKIKGTGIRRKRTEINTSKKNKNELKRSRKRKGKRGNAWKKKGLKKNALKRKSGTRKRKKGYLR
jgi:hypothetical protein